MHILLSTTLLLHTPYLISLEAPTPSFLNLHPPDFTLLIHVTLPIQSSSFFTIFSNRTLPHSFLSTHTPKYLNSSTSSSISPPIFQLTPASLFPTTMTLLFKLLNFIFHRDTCASTTSNIACYSATRTTSSVYISAPRQHPSNLTPNWALSNSSAIPIK